MKRVIRVLAWGTGLAFLVLWWGPIAFNQWQVDRLVDELCAMDGRVKVYEPAARPARVLVQSGAMRIPYKDARTGADPYYYENDTVLIYTDSGSAGDIGLRRHHDRLIRAADGKLLAERVVYERQRGEQIGFWQPSRYACPRDGAIDALTRKAFAVK